MPISFTAHGFYKAFVEFVPDGSTQPELAVLDVEVASAKFSIDDYGWSDNFKWWILLLGSFVFMTPLVYGVRRYINAPLS
jgi:hypothetical protein